MNCVLKQWYTDDPGDPIVNESEHKDPIEALVKLASDLQKVGGFETFRAECFIKAERQWSLTVD